MTKSMHLLALLHLSLLLRRLDPVFLLDLYPLSHLLRRLDQCPLLDLADLVEKSKSMHIR